MTSTLSNTGKLPTTCMDSVQKKIYLLASTQNCLIKEKDTSVQKKDVKFTGMPCIDIKLKVKEKL